MMMRATLVLGVLAACGQSGLLLDVHGSKDAKLAKVEVFIPDGSHETGMGMPPAQSQKTQGTVWQVIDTVTASASGNSAQILLQPGTMDQVPALLVLGYDGNHDAVSYALVTDPKGPILLRHNTSDEIVVDLEPITEVTVQASRTTASTTRLARWSAQAVDVNDGPCVALIHPDGTGDFFGPKDDKDCDGAQPECDDTWYLHSYGAGKCATQMPPAADNTQDACRIGNTAGCTDNVSSDGACAAMTMPGVCVPMTVCDQCQGLITSTCARDAIVDPQTATVQCTVAALMNGGLPPALCPNRTTTLDMSGQFATPWECSGLAGFGDILNGTTPTASTALKSSQDTLDFACHGGTTAFSFSITGTGDALDPTLLPTTGLLVFGVQPGTMAGPARVLVLPVVSTYMPVQICPTEAISCSFEPGVDGGGQPVDDPMWHCSGL